jgi:hypothetical protein
MSISPTDVAIREACCTHAPRSLADDLRRVPIRVTKYSVKHFAVADAIKIKSINGKEGKLIEILHIPNDSGNVITREVTGMLVDKALGNHNPRHLVCCECAIIGLCLPVPVALSNGTYV